MIDPSLIDVEYDADETGFQGVGNQAFGSEFPSHLLLDESEWRDRIREIETNNPFKGGPHPDYALLANYWPTGWNWDQSPTSMCVAYASCGAWARRYAFAMGLGESGKPLVMIPSPASVYTFISWGQHSGAYIADGLEALAQNGLLLSKERHSGDQEITLAEKVYRGSSGWSDMPDGSREVMQANMALEWLKINTFQEYGSALLQQMPVVIGRSGHSMVAEDLCWDNGWYARICDSYGWSSRDGTGRVFDSERTMRNSIGGAWALRNGTLPEYHEPDLPGGS